VVIHSRYYGLLLSCSNGSELVGAKNTFEGWCWKVLFRLS